MTVETSKLKEILRWALSTSLSDNRIAERQHVARGTVKKYRQLAQAHKLVWDTLEPMSEEEIEKALQAPRHRLNKKRLPDFVYIQQQMQLDGMTQQLLWEEYKLANPDNAYEISQFNDLYRRHKAHVDVAMRKTYKAGKLACVDFSGEGLKYTNPVDLVLHRVQVFVACLPCSNYIFACATESQKTEDWIVAHIKFFAFIGGVPEAVVCDNLKAAVIRAGAEPEFNAAYKELQQVYRFVVLPARVGTPTDNAKAEYSVKLVKRWILKRLRNFHFSSLAEINAALEPMLRDLNNRAFRHYPGCRLSLFQEVEKPKLKPLPAMPYVYGVWISAQKVGRDHHICVEHNFYSVPYTLVQEYVEAKITASTVEIYHRLRRVATHARSVGRGETITIPSHRPAAHSAYAEQTPAYFIEWAKAIGPAVVTVVEVQFSRQPHPLPAMRACSSLRNLSKHYGPERLVAACERALLIHSPTVKSVKSILQHHIDGTPLPNTPVQTTIPFHENLRGRDYYSGGH